jgi:hypothetical protein
VDKHLDSRDSLSRWLVDFHNKVNARLGKPEYDYEAAKREFVSDDATCSVQSSCGDAPSRQESSLPKWIAFLVAVFVVALIVGRFL